MSDQKEYNTDENISVVFQDFQNGREEGGKQKPSLER